MNPPDGATDVPVNVRIEAQLDERLGALGVAPDALRLLEGISEVAGSLSVSGQKLIFTPEEDLTPDTIYTIEVDGSTERTIHWPG